MQQRNMRTSSRSVLTEIYKDFMEQVHGHSGARRAEDGGRDLSRVPTGAGRARR